MEAIVFIRNIVIRNTAEYSNTQALLTKEIPHLVNPTWRGNEFKNSNSLALRRLFEEILVFEMGVAQSI